MHSRRIEKINSLIKETLAKAIAEDSAAEMGLITVTGAHVTPDIREVRVYVEILSQSKKPDEVMEYLESHRKQYQDSLAKLGLKFTPSIRFTLDKGSFNVSRVEELLNHIKHNGKA